MNYRVKYRGNSVVHSVFHRDEGGLDSRLRGNDKGGKKRLFCRAASCNDGGERLLRGAASHNDEVGDVRFRGNNGCMDSRFCIFVLDL